MANGVLALNDKGGMTFCTAPKDRRGMGRCNHVLHQEDGQSPQEFVEEAKKYIEKRGDRTTFEENKFLDGEDIEIKQYKMSDAEKDSLVKIEAARQLDTNLESSNGAGFITSPDPIWNQTDVNAFAQVSGLRPSDIANVVEKESWVVLEVPDPAPKRGRSVWRRGMVIDDPSIVPEGVIVGQGAWAMNKYASEDYDFEATKDVYVIPYYMREGSGNPKNDTYVASDITNGYKGLLTRISRNPRISDPNETDEERRRRKLDLIQHQYEVLLHNQKLAKYHQENMDINRENQGRRASNDPSQRRQLHEFEANVYKSYLSSSLEDKFAGKSGIFRGKLLGGNVPYTARSVISPNKDLQYGHTAVPPRACVDIFRPTLIKQLAEEGKTNDEIHAWLRKYKGEQTEISDEDRKELSDRMKKGNVRLILNRQPSLHTSSLQSFRPEVSPNATVQMHPLYCTAFAGDFDGDTVSISGVNPVAGSAIIDKVDRSMDANLPINTRVPRAQDESEILPTKDALFGLYNILKKRSN